MILRTPARKRRMESLLHEDDENNMHNTPTRNSGNQLLIFEDLPLAQNSHDHSLPASSDQLLCTYQCRQMVKSEFFDALSSAEKQAHDFQSKVEELSNNLSKAEAERKNFQDQLFNMEQELAASNRREEVLQEQLKKEVDFSQEHLRKQIHSFSELEVKFRNEMELRQKAESLAAKAEEKASFLQEKLTTVSESIDREKSRLQSELGYMKSESKSSISRISADLERMECRAKSAEKESALLEEQLEELKKRLDELMQERRETQKKSPVASPDRPSRDANLLVKHLQEELKNYESEVREARKIKSSHENIELLKEKLQEEKIRRAKAEVDLRKLSDLQFSIDQLENQLSTWRKVIMDIPGVSSADDIIEKFAGLQKEVVDSIMKAGEAQTRMTQIQVALDSAMLSKQNAETDAAMFKVKAESYKAEIKRLEPALASTKDEMDRLKNVIKELKEKRTCEGGTPLASGTVVQDLEASLDEKEKYFRELESSLREQTEISNRQQNEIMLLNDRLSNEAKRVKMLEREGDRFRAEISLLESKLGHGEFSSANTKVLRMVNTLAVDNEAKQTIEALQKELQKTKEKLQAFEELKKQSSDAGTLVDSEVAGKLKQLKEQIATLEKREERYKMVFAERISVFRRACCELFGYKIVMDDHQRPDGIPVTRFTLLSIYAFSDDEKLQFDYESGNTNIVVNGYTAQPEISRQVEIFIRKMNSVPAFTANLTVESFNKRTLS